MTPLGRSSVRSGAVIFSWGTLGASLACVACSVPPPAPGSAPGASHVGEKSADDVIQAPTTVVTAGEALTTEELLLRAAEKLRNEEYDAAAQDYRLVFEHGTSRDERLRGLLGWGTALDQGGHPREALGAYSRFVAEAPRSDLREEVAVRQVRLLVYLERYADAGKAAAALDAKHRTPLQQVALLAASAHHSLVEDRLKDAERSIAHARAIIDEHSFDRVTVPPLDVASLYVALGELRGRRAELIQFDPLPPDFTLRLEARCQLILDAQSAFSEAMRSEDAHWSSMSGVKVGRLYQSLHADLTGMPFPDSAVTPEKKQLFEGAIRLRYSILLTKSLAMMKATVALLDRTNQQSPWREKARQALRDIEQAQKQEEVALSALPYSRAQLQQVLDEMAAAARRGAPS